MQFYSNTLSPNMTTNAPTAPIRPTSIDEPPMKTSPITVPAATAKPYTRGRRISSMLPNLLRNQKAFWSVGEFVG